MREEITIMLSSTEPEGQQFLPSIGIPHLAPFKVKKEKLAESLAELIEDVSEVIKLAQTKSEFAQLESISITAQVSAEGGISWIGQATVGYNNAMTLTFRIPPKESQAG